MTDRGDVTTQPCQTAGQVREMMTPDPICVSPDTPIAEVLRTMSERRFRHMPVTDEDGRLIGMVSQRDLIVVSSGPAGAEAEHPVSKLMRTQLDTLDVTCCAAQAARHMLRSKRSCLPVVDSERKIIGILTEADYLRLATRGVPPCTCVGVTSADS